MQSNGNVQEAARDSALIYARMIDSLARNYKLPVENIVATIHTNEGFQNGMYGLPAHNVRADGITDIGGYYEEIKKRMSGNNEKLKNVSKITICKKHGFSTEELMDMERHINSIYNPTVYERYRNGQKGQFGGISVYGLIKGDKDNYFVVISFLENGTIRLETAVKDKDANTYKNKMELSHPLQLTDNAAAQQGNDNSPISIGNIQKILGIVKKKNYYQQAEGYTGKKDLIAYHNISQDNLDKAIQLGGLAVPSIAITKKETDFSNFGDITLLMPQDLVNPKETPVYTRDAWTGVFPVCLCRKKFCGLLWITETCILLYSIKISYNISKHRAALDVSNVFNRAKYVYFR